MSTSGKRLTPEFAPGEKPSPTWIINSLKPYKPIISAVPFLLLAVESLLAFIARSLYGDTDWLIKLMLCQLLAVNCTFSGLLHFYRPFKSFYTSMIFLPYKEVWLYSSGLALSAGGLLVAFTRTQVIGAWTLVATFVIIFPGNVACVFMPTPRKLVCGGSTIGAILRLPFQFLFIYWAHWFTTAINVPSL